MPQIRLYIEPRLGNILVSKLKPAHLSELYTFLLSSGRRGGLKGLSSKTVRHVHSIINAALVWAMKMQLVSKNVAAAVDLPHIRRSEAKAFSVEEATKLLNAAKDSAIGSLVVLAFTTGARRGELLGMRWHDVNFEARYVTIKSSLSEVGGLVRLKGTKTNRSRRVPLSTLAIDALRKQRAYQAQQKLLLREAYKDEGFVFSTPTGDPWVPSAVTDKFRKLARQCGVSSTRLHDARHTAATWLITEGVDIPTVGAILGHAAPSTTLNIYSHAIAGAAESAVEKIDEHLARGQAV